MKKICSIFLSLLVILSCVLFCSACGKPSFDDVFQFSVSTPYQNEEPIFLTYDEINNSDLSDFSFIHFVTKKAIEFNGVTIIADFDGDGTTEGMVYHEADGIYEVGEEIWITPLTGPNGLLDGIKIHNIFYELI